MQLFELSPPTAFSILSFVCVAVILPLGIAGFAILRSRSAIHPVIRIVLVVAILALPIVAMRSMLVNRSIEIDGGSIAVKSSFYTVRLMHSEIRRAGIGVLKEGALPGGGVSYRANGIGLPGYRSGWFVLKNGRRIFASMTDGELVFIPTIKNYDLVLSVPDAGSLIGAIAAP